MKKNKRNSNIILRVSDAENDIISIKSQLFNKKKSEYIRKAAFGHWEDISNTKHFKTLLELYQKGNTKQKKQIVEVLFRYYREKGFPHTKLEDAQKENRMRRIMMSKKILLEDNHLQTNHQGIDLANSFHPHMMDAYYSRGENSPMETFLDDNKLKDCINRWLELGNIPNEAGMRRILKTRNGTRGVGNFKPVIAKFIYDSNCPVDGKVLDPCAGYGGRLSGCIASNKGIYYHGIDPNSKTAIGNIKMADFFSMKDILNSKVYDFNFRFDLGCAEEVMPSLSNEYDLIFTSPPYFDTEVYSSEINQSYNKYNEYKQWLKYFLQTIVDESKRLLTKNGKLVLNIKNSTKYKIADDLCEYCKCNWNLEKTYHMRLANSEFHRNGDYQYHTEPIFIFSKKL